MRTVRHDNTHWYVRAQGKGSIPIVIDTAWGGFSAEWWGIQERLANVTRVVTYDRAGYGWSGRASFPRTTERIARELRAALVASDINPPYVLVGHSLGGLNMQHFARLFPNEVLGVVFIDPVSAENNRFKAELSPQVYQGSGVDKSGNLRWMELLARLRLLRWLKPLMMKSPPFFYYKQISDEQRATVWRHYQRPDTYPTAADEYAQAFTPENRAALDEKPFPPVPIAVIYHDQAVVIKEIVQYGGLRTDQAAQVEALWEALTRSYLALSPRSRWIIAPDASHMIHLDRPDLVIAAITELVTAIQSMEDNAVR